MSTTIYAVDRIEGDTAVLLGDDEKVLEIPANRLPRGTTEGTVLELDQAGTSGALSFRILHAETAARRARLAAKARKLAAGDPGGDLIL